eukprot:TRINITY_DN23134_c0_g1_i1.p1 TRINITY_DN23134_c0_g1~~TRINITY_DN23134_c0_g1_i1.p1  ORF type:complete len:237 (+),score=28.01 TRINITY_DN23134_c0_g1_i1:110-820(+)
MRAVVLGGSGQVGSRLVAMLRDSSDVERITLISRRPLPEFEQDSRIEVRVVDPLDRVDSADLTGHNTAFMMLGFGKASTATKEDLLRVDATIPVAFANACRSSGVSRFAALSAVGSDASATWSSITRTGAGGGWYNHCKGIMEEGVLRAGFERVGIIRPAGIYPGNDNTPATFGWLVSKAQCMMPQRFENASADEVAGATLAAVRESSSAGTQVIVDGGRAVKEWAAKLVGPASSR